MLSLSPELVTVYKYASPPLIGAFIGYFTNHVAIKMLFRPLAPWKILGMKVPMTPGVIPAKRYQLADNFGEVVGEHLLTSAEIGNALQQPTFQAHLLGMFRDRIDVILRQDLGDISSLIPHKFKVYFDIGRKTVAYQVREKLRNYIGSEEFREFIEPHLEQQLTVFLSQSVEKFLPNAERNMLYKSLETVIEQMVSDEKIADWINESIKKAIYRLLQEQRSLADILPESLQGQVMDFLNDQMPAILKQIATNITSRDMQEIFVRAGYSVVSSFIDSLGPMADIARNLLTRELIENKIRSYLKENEENIVGWVTSDEMREKLLAIFLSKWHELLKKPLVSLVKAEHQKSIDDISLQVSRFMSSALREAGLSRHLIQLVESNVEAFLMHGELSLTELISLIFKEEYAITRKQQILHELGNVLQSANTVEAIEPLVDVIIQTVINKKIGRLADFIPAGVRQAIAESMQKKTLDLLALEVPGLVESLNIKKIVTEKLNSLDILKLEGLLLSIMQEQFKYINLFGALLGFLIGCLNLVML